MEPAELARHTGREGRRLLETAVRDRAAPVPTCPGWNADDLLDHMSTVWQALETMISQRPSEPVDPRNLAGDVAPSEALDALVAAVAGADPTADVWTWGHDKTVAFWLRRARNETVVHRLDAEAAAADPTPVDPDVAADATAELFEQLVGGSKVPMPTGSLHLHQTDGEGELMLTVDDSRIVVAHEHAKGDAALRGTGTELLAVMWRRRPVDGLELFGDADVVEQWRALAP